MSKSTDIQWHACGAELANDAEVPEILAKLMAHVALNLQAHANWVGTPSIAATKERDALLEVATAYYAIAEAARSAASHMRRLANLEPAPHDAARWDHAAFGSWMANKVSLQTQLANLLLSHATSFEQARSGP